MFEAVNAMMLDMLAAISRKDYDDAVAGRHRESPGQRQRVRMKGQPEDAQRNAAIVEMLRRGQSWNSIVKATGASRSTLSRLRKKAIGSISSSTPPNITNRQNSRRSIGPEQEEEKGQGPIMNALRRSRKMRIFRLVDRSSEAG